MSQNFSQRDPRWAGVELGTAPGATIGDFGCFLTSNAMIATHLGIATDPVDLNQRMIAAGLYVAPALSPVQRDLWRPGDLPALFPSVLGTPQVYSCETIPCDMSKLFAPPGVEGYVALKDPPSFPLHCVRLASWDGHTLIVDDPWTGHHTVWPFNDPVRTIVQVVHFPLAPAPAQPPQPADPCADLRTQLAAAEAEVNANIKATMDLEARREAWLAGFPK